MTTTKSIINSADLNGGTAYVQINPYGIDQTRKATLSFDIKNMSYAIVISLDELKEFANIINKSLEENE